MLLWSTMAAASPVGAGLDAAWSAARADAVWRSPTRPERELVVEGVRLLAAAAVTCDEGARLRAADPLAQAGLKVRTLADGIWVVEEDAERRGSGLLALRCGEADAVTLQAPHGRYDLGTGELVIALFAESRVRAAQWNTVHRYRAVAGEQPTDPVHPADVAHQPGSLFHAATLGLALADPALRVVQLHGFAEGRVASEAVLSSGSADRPPLAAAERWRALSTVSVFGHDTDQLGGTQNAQRAALPERFLQVELSPAVRERLAGDAAQRALLVESVVGPWF